MKVSEIKYNLSTDYKRLYQLLKEGNIIGVKAGMKAPIDGVIVKGKAYIDESAITGESIPVFKEEGEVIWMI